MNKNKIIALTCPALFLAFGIYIIVESNTFKGSDGIFPIMTGVLMVIVSFIQFIKDLLTKDHKNPFVNSNIPRVLLYVAVLMLYAYLLKKIGYVFDTLWLTAFTLYTLQYKNWKGLVLIPVVITAFLFLIFKVLLKVPLPTLWI